jgi:hypothetical protein
VLFFRDKQDSDRSTYVQQIIGKVSIFIYKLTHWETWPHYLKYIPIYPVWFWYCFKAKSVWFFTPSNPTLTFGGFEGESKQEMYQQLPADTYPTTVMVEPGEDFDNIVGKIKKAGISFPFAVKPDIGMMGFLFRQIESPESLMIYHTKMPVTYLVQTLVEFPIEVSVFYYRMPSEKTGTISGLIRKEYLQVTGDGKSTIQQLIEKHPTARFRREELFTKHRKRLPEVLPAAEVFVLSQALNLSRGGKLVSLEHEKDDRLLALFDGLSHYTGAFYYGRYDIKCNSIEELREGKNYSILEYNGSGAEPHHVYGNGYSLYEAYRILLFHWKMLYRISKYNSHRGITYWPFKKGYRFLFQAKKHFRVLKKLDNEMPVFGSSINRD